MKPEPTLNLKHSTLNPAPYTIIPQPSSLNHTRESLKPEARTNHKPASERRGYSLEGFQGVSLQAQTRIVPSLDHLIRARFARQRLSPEPHLTESVYTVVSQKLIPAQIRQLILCISIHEG